MTLWRNERYAFLSPALSREVEAGHSPPGEVSFFQAHYAVEVTSSNPLHSCESRLSVS